MHDASGHQQVGRTHVPRLVNRRGVTWGSVQRRVATHEVRSASQPTPGGVVGRDCDRRLLGACSDGGLNGRDGLGWSSQQPSRERCAAQCVASGERHRREPASVPRQSHARTTTGYLNTAKVCHRDVVRSSVVGLLPDRKGRGVRLVAPVNYDWRTPSRRDFGGDDGTARTDFPIKFIIGV